MWRLATLLLLAGAGAVSGHHDIYAGNRVFGFEIADAAQADAFHAYELQWDLDVWQHPTAPTAPAARPGAVMVPARLLQEFSAAMADAGIEHWVDIPDVAEYLREQDAQRARAAAQRNNRVLPFQDYPRYAEIDAYMVQVAANHPDLVTLVSAGPSFENRDIKYLKISTTGFTDESKPVVIVDAMIHAREWVTTPVAILGIHRLVEDVLAEDRDLLEDIDWIIMPLVNPDGYEYSHTDERLWRKTRSTTHPNGTECPGVDGNRNFDFEFGTLGVSFDPCSNTYPGTEPNSEPEVRYVTQILQDNLNRTELYIALHSSGNFVLFGYGNRSLPANAMQLHHAGAAIGTAMDSSKLPEAWYYLVGNSAMLLYETSGIAQDYAQALGVPLAYTLELPGYGVGHQVPVQYMEHVALETWEGVKAGARQALIHHRARAAAN